MSESNKTLFQQGRLVALPGMEHAAELGDLVAVYEEREYCVYRLFVKVAGQGFAGVCRVPRDLQA